jgi:E3 ubiquitin-protein ligase RAD18
MNEIDDEWVWPMSLIEARQMEGFLRCQVCGDFLSGPVLLRECRHSFCSECVRKHLLTRGTNGCCPECKHACSAGDLIPNRPLEQLVGLFCLLKPKILRLAEGRGTTIEEATTLATPTKASSKDGDEKNNNATPKRVPIVSYSLMKDKQIQHLMEKAGLTDLLHVSRETMIACHKEVRKPLDIYIYILTRVYS